MCFRYDSGVNVISYLQTPATRTNRAVHAQAIFFTSPEHQPGGSSGASQGAHNSSFLNTLLVAIALLDVMLYQLYQHTTNRRTVIKKRSLSNLSVPAACESVHVDQIIDLFTPGILEG